MLVQLLTILLCLRLISTTEFAILEIPNGAFLGIDRNSYYSFEGIPYAEPPIGVNRFESPKPYAQTWTDLRNATELHETCIQYPDPLSLTDDINGSEDCLYLNIYTPSVNKINGKIYPVIFYVHGDGFMYGSGDVLREKILMKHGNIVLVTFNYRLNIFGFLSTGDTSITGNMGLKDQLLALKWVKENIMIFKGDPENILITGFSSGSASVEYLTLSPNIDHFANAAFCMSGSALNNWAFNSDPTIAAIKLGQLLDCPTENSMDMKTCLKTRSANDIVSNVKYFQNFYGSSIGVFAPVAEHESVKDAVITEEPRQLIKKGKFSEMPIIFSYTAEDGALFTSSIYNNMPDIIKSENIHFLAGEAWLIGESGHSENENLFDDMSNGNYTRLTKLFTDRIFKNGIIDSLDLRRRNDNSKAYAYIYDNPAPFGLGNLIAKEKDINFGCNHGDDVFLMFNFPPRDAYPFRKDEQNISDNFVNMMITFVTKGVAVFGDIELPKVTADKFEYLHIKADNYKIESF